MPDTLDNITLRKETGYVDIYALSGLAVGVALVIQNQTTRQLSIHIGAVKPDLNPIPDPNDGSDYDPVIPVTAFVLVPPNLEDLAFVEDGATGCWIKGDGSISVQEDV